MTDDARHRLLSGARVSLLVIEELRLAQKEGRIADGARMIEQAHLAAAKLEALVAAYNERQRVRRGWR